MNPIAEDILMHYGTKRHSGRYPWGSGDTPHQHSGDFLSRVDDLKKKGVSEKDIMDSMGLSSTEYRDAIAIAKADRRVLEVQQVKSLKADGLSNSEIGRRMGKPESSIRSLLNEESEAKMNEARSTAKFLKEQVDTKGMIDVGTGVERELNISPERLRQALYVLEMEEGYTVHGRGVPQVTNPGKQTNLKVLCPPETTLKDVYDADLSEIKSVREYVSHDQGETFDTFVYPKSMNSSRLKICYAEEGGTEKDGVIELRRGVKDLSLGESHYSQVRILVDDNKYLKGMAVYADDDKFPPGVDVIFNTNKAVGTPMGKVLKDIKNDPANPFGSAIKKGGQSYYYDENGKKQLSLINKRADQSDWSDWQDTLPSQFLSKQSLTLAKRQLNAARDDKLKEFETICAYTNPTVKKQLLETFANDCDSAAVHLKAAALPRQKYHVILPLPSMKDTEVYAPQYKDGEKVALIRYPHGGTFEIPVLTVNNKISLAKKLLGNTAQDAICINSKVAERLSGADFDGDTVMVIPTNDKVKITSTDPLDGLKGFDPKMSYPYREGMTVMTKRNTQMEMGKVSNLITDMTLRGATNDELARAVRHSMVVIDAEKHKLDYKRSFEENQIASLKEKYQGGPNAGASTLISRAGAQYSVDKRQGQARINQKGKEWYDPNKPEGALIWKTADDLYYEKTTVNKKTGEVTTKQVKRTQQSTRMAETDDARTLISDANTPMEKLYADYANTMKSLANQARTEYLNTPDIKYSRTAKETYLAEVRSLEAKLNVSLKNAPKERQAQLIANSKVEAKKKSNPDMTKEDIRKASQQELTAARNALGAKRETIPITDKEWEAIQAGAISANQLTKILKNADMGQIKQYATPRNTTSLSSAQVARISAMAASGLTIAQIAESMGKSPSTISKYLNGKE